MKQRFYAYLLGFGLLLLLLAHAGRLLELQPLTRLDAVLYDAKVRFTLPGGVDERIVIIDLDEHSLVEVGRWPWGRDRLARMVTAAFEDYGVVLLGMDVILAEADDSSGLPVLDGLAKGPLRNSPGFRAALADLRPTLDYDRHFADVLAKYPVILGTHFSDDRRGIVSGSLPPPVLNGQGLAAGRALIPKWAGFAGSRPEFQRAAAGAGYTNALTDVDGISRHIPLLAQYGGAYYQALSLAVVRVIINNREPVPVWSHTGWFATDGPGVLEALDLPSPRGSLRIPVDVRGMALIPFRGLEGSFPYYPAADLLAGRIPKDALRGKIALLGTTAPGLLDLRAMPVGETYPGIEAHANMVSGILDGRVKSTPPFAPGLEMLLLLIIGLYMILRLPTLSPLRTTIMSAAVLLLALSINLSLWEGWNIALPLAPTLILILGQYVIDMSFGYFAEARSRRRLARLFGRYVPPELVDVMSRNPNRYTMEGRSLELTVMFADIRGFTAISETMEPKILAQLMNEYFSAMTAVIRDQRGTLDKYVGDAIMAFWGAPVEDPRHAQHAVLAALQMQLKHIEVNALFAERGWPRLATGIGINTGVMTVGDMGSRERKAYTVLGDSVNLGSRLEGLTAQYGVGIIIGEATRRGLTGIVCRELDRVRVKGRAGVIAIYEPIAPEAEVDDDTAAELGAWHEALAQYRAGEWDNAETGLQRLAAAAPQCKLYALFLRRLAVVRTGPQYKPWNGVWEFDTK